MRIWLILLVFLSSIAQAQDLISKVIPLNYAKPNEVIAALNPMLQPGESIRVYQNSLIVMVSPETLTKIRPLIHQLDVEPTIFLISIHQGNADWLADQDDSVHYTTNSGQSQADNQAIQVENGAYAFISTGNDYPVINQVSAGWVTGVGYQRMQSEKGFLVQPELKGSQVKITIKRKYSQQNPTNQEAQQQQASSTSTIIALDKWTKLAQTGGPEYPSSSNSNTYHAGNSFDSKGTLFIKVSVLNKNETN